MATAIWNEKEKRWKLDATIDGRRKVFTSIKPGMSGKRAVGAKRLLLDNSKSGLLLCFGLWFICGSLIQKQTTKSNKRTKVRYLITAANGALRRFSIGEL